MKHYKISAEKVENLKYQNSLFLIKMKKIVFSAPTEWTFIITIGQHNYRVWQSRDINNVWNFCFECEIEIHLCKNTSEQVSDF